MRIRTPKPFTYAPVLEPNPFDWLTQLARAYNREFPAESFSYLIGTEHSDGKNRERKMLKAAFEAALAAGVPVEATK